MAQNLMIDGTVFHGVDSISMTNDTGVKITYIEKTNVGTGVPVAQIGDRQFYTAEDALAAAVSGDVVTLIADTAEAVNLIIPAGVTMDLRGYSLTANGVIGLNGSYLTATCPDTSGNGGGNLIVPQKKLILSENSFVDGSNYNILPVWTGSEYIFSRLFTHQNNMNNPGLEVTDDTITFRFRFNATSYVKNTYLKDGCGDNALRVITRITWDSYDADGNLVGKASQDFAFSEAQVGSVAGGTSAFRFTLSNYKSLDIDLEKGNVKISGMIITDSGAVAHNVQMDVSVQ